MGLDEVTLPQKEREGLLYSIQGFLKDNVASFQREIVQRVARGKLHMRKYDGAILEMYQAYLASEEFLQDAENGEYLAVLSDAVRESPTPFLNIAGEGALSDREIVEHPFTRRIMQQSTVALHPRYKYHLRVQGTDHYLTEDPEYARAALGDWKIVALRRKERNTAAGWGGPPLLRLEFAGDDEYAADRSAAAKIKRITGSEYNWSSFNDEAYAFSRMLFRATPHVSRPYPAEQLHFAPAMPSKDLLADSFIVTVVHPAECLSKTLPVTAQTTVKDLFAAVSRKFGTCKSPAVDDTAKFALKVCGFELYLVATNDLPLLQAPRIARAVRRGKRITFVIVAADALVLESPVPIDLELPRAPSVGVVPSPAVARPLELTVASGTLPLDRQCPHLRVEAAVYYGGRPISSYFVTHAELPALTDRRLYEWNSKISFDILIPYLPRESRVCIAVFSVPKHLTDPDASKSVAAKASKSLLELVPPEALMSSAMRPTAAAAANNNNNNNNNDGNNGSGALVASGGGGAGGNGGVGDPSGIGGGGNGGPGTSPGVPGDGLGGGIGGIGNDGDNSSPSPLVVSSERGGVAGAAIGGGGGVGSGIPGGAGVAGSGIVLPDSGSGVGGDDGKGGNGGIGDGNGGNGGNGGDDKKGNESDSDIDIDSDSDSDEEDMNCVLPVYWTSFPVYNYRSVLISGPHSLQMLKGKVNPIGICVHAMNLHESACLRVEMPMEATVVYSEEDDGGDADATAAIQEQRREAEAEAAVVPPEDMAKLDKLIVTDSLYALNEAEKALIWKYRYYLKTKPQSIIKLMLAVPSTDYHITNEIHS